MGRAGGRAGALVHNGQHTFIELSKQFNKSKHNSPSFASSPATGRPMPVPMLLAAVPLPLPPPRGQLLLLVLIQRLVPAAFRAEH
eukprot:SAG22_NODE_17406_length_305_cov_1.004854_1_plen_84_part_10